MLTATRVYANFAKNEHQRHHHKSPPYGAIYSNDTCFTVTYDQDCERLLKSCKARCVLTSNLGSVIHVESDVPVALLVALGCVSY